MKPLINRNNNCFKPVEIAERIVYSNIEATIVWGIKDKIMVGNNMLFSFYYRILVQDEIRESRARSISIFFTSP